MRWSLNNLIHTIPHQQKHTNPHYSTPTTKKNIIKSLYPLSPVGLHETGWKSAFRATSEHVASNPIPFTCEAGTSLAFSTDWKYTKKHPAVNSHFPHLARHCKHLPPPEYEIKECIIYVFTTMRVDLNGNIVIIPFGLTFFIAVVFLSGAVYQVISFSLKWI